MRWSTCFFIGFAHLALSKPLQQWGEMKIKHAWADIPRGWELYGDARADHMLDLHIGLTQNRLDELITSLYEVSDPAHERYGAHLSREEVHHLIAPHPTSLSLVESWLQSHGIDPTSAIHSGASSWLRIQLPVAKVERMLGTKYSMYFNPSTNSYVIRTLAYSLPEKLHPHIDVISPTTYFGSLQPMKATSFVMPNTIIAAIGQIDPSDPMARNCSTKVTPACLRALYNSSTYVPSPTRNNTLAIAGYLNEYANYADLQTFFGQFRPDASGTNFTTILVNGGQNLQSDPGLEANLDIQYTEGISYPIPNIYYSTGGSPPFNPDDATPTNTNEPYVDWLNHVLNQTEIPQTISTSYGDDEQTVPLDYARRVCTLFAQLGVRGSSVMFSSGDNGVGAGNCKTNDGTESVIFQPVFPASCPFVTAVGGTTLIPEVAASLSGGGFSNYFPQPSYQVADVAEYLSTLGAMYAGLYNRSGRAYPDVAAQAERFQVVLRGSVMSVAGTSCSAPTVAAIVSLLNDVRLSRGKSALGFLNPLLYSTARSGLNDITVGTNPGCSTAGFAAGRGWDPVTGLGTPDFGRLAQLI